MFEIKNHPPIFMDLHPDGQITMLDNGASLGFMDTVKIAAISAAIMKLKDPLVAISPGPGLYEVKVKKFRWFTTAPSFDFIKM